MTGRPTHLFFVLSERKKMDFFFADPNVHKSTCTIVYARCRDASANDRVIHIFPARPRIFSPFVDGTAEEQAGRGCACVDEGGGRWVPDSQCERIDLAI